MLIEFRCPNLINDSGHQHPQRCQKKLRAPVEKVGAVVTCPNCHQKLQIPAKGMKAAADVETEPTSLSPKPPTPPTDPHKKFDVMQHDFESDASTSNSQSQNFVPIDRNQRCRKCGRQLTANGSCTQCNYVEPSMKLANIDLANVKIQPVGFQRWLINILSEGIPAWAVAVTLHVLMLMLAFALAAAILVVAEGLMQVALAGILIAAVAFYLGLTYKSYRFLRNPSEKLAWFQRPFWDLVLAGIRRRGWQTEGRLRIVIDQRNQPISDDQVDQLDDLKNAAVLDLEGTQITDQAFRYFYRMEKLEFLVLKNTDVSHDSVFRLQQTKPKLWVWY